MPTASVGIDVGRAHLDVCVLPADLARRLPDTPAGHRQRVAALLPLAGSPSDIRAVVESTGGLELARAREEAGFEIAVVKPERVRDFAQARGRPAETDALDARTPAEFARAITPLPAEELRHVRDLLGRRAPLVEMRTMDSNRLATTALKHARKSLEKHVAWLDREIGGIEAELDRRVAANPQRAEIDRRLQSIPAVGPRMSRVLIGHPPELGHADRTVIGRRVGVAPVANDGGTTDGPRHIVGGRKQVRNALYMVAVVAVRWNPVGKALYARRKAEGESSESALIAVAHKLLAIANATVAQKTTWRHSNVAVPA